MSWFANWTVGAWASNCRLLDRERTRLSCDLSFCRENARLHASLPNSREPANLSEACYEFKCRELTDQFRAVDAKYDDRCLDVLRFIAAASV